MVYEDASFEVERSLLQLEIPSHWQVNSPTNNQLATQSKHGNLLLIVKELGIWLVKFRSSGIIYNRKDLILPELIKYDAKITFRNLAALQHTVLGQYEEEIHQGNIEYSGSTEVLKIFREACMKAAEASSSLSTFEIPLRETRTIVSIGEEQPLKKGWLLKKRDIISGWKCRYFELFRGRLLYYREANDVKPRGCILLANAEVGKVHSLRIKRVADHFGFTIEAKRPEKAIRIASERTGIDGKAEAEGWYQALIYASDVVDLITDDTTGNTATTTRKPSTSSANTAGSRNSTGSSGNRSSGLLLARKMSFGTALRGGGEESRMPMILSATMITLLAVVLHYLWQIKQWISTKLYITLGILILVLVIIFCQEFIFVTSGEEDSDVANPNHHNNSNNNSNSESQSGKSGLEEATGGGGDNQSTDGDSETSSEGGNDTE